MLMPTKSIKSDISERVGFSNRLKTSMESADLPISATVLERLFNSHASIPLSVHAVRKWLIGESIPRQTHLRTLSVILGVSVTWLRFGDDSIFSIEKAITANEEMLLSDFRCLTKNTQTHISSLIRSLALEEKKRK
jgi:hypothetical protein